MERRYAVLGLALAVGAGAGIGAAVLSAGGAVKAAAPSRPAATWAAHDRPARAFRLEDQHGRPVSPAGLRGRTAIVSFVDPLCRDLCPLEAKVLTRVAHDLGARAPALVAVSVNPPADTRANFAKDARAWRLPASWRWAIGPPAALARVWRAYGVGVRVMHRTVVGVRVREVAHTEAAFVVDAAGYQRAVFIYPFTAADVEQELKSLGP